MLYLRQSTASQSLLIGPFVDSTDGNTAETALTIANTDIRLSKNGGNIVAKTSGGGTHDELGYYTITLDATDTDTVGRLQLMVHMAGALPVYHEVQVLEEAVFDGLFAASAGALATAASVAALNNLSEAQVNAQVVDALATDTYAEPGQGSPGATISIADKISYLYKAWRNRTTQTSSEYALYADDGLTKDHEATLTDDGTTTTRGEVTTGA